MSFQENVKNAFFNYEEKKTDYILSNTGRSAVESQAH